MTFGFASPSVPFLSSHRYLTPDCLVKIEKRDKLGTNAHNLCIDWSDESSINSLNLSNLDLASIIFSIN